MPDPIKTSVLGEALAATDSKFDTLKGRISQSLTPVFGKAADGSSAVPAWLVPLVLLVAAGYVAVKFLPKLFKKGRGTRSVTRR